MGEILQFSWLTFRETKEQSRWQWPKQQSDRIRAISLNTSQVIMPKSTKKKRKPPAMSVAQIYNEDIGFGGLKKKRTSATGDIFNLPIDEQEERKRQQRMVGYPLLKTLL